MMASGWSLSARTEQASLASAHYVGSAARKKCHQDIYARWKKTPMANVEFPPRLQVCSRGFQGICSRPAARGIAKSLTLRAMMRSGFNGSLVARNPRWTSVATIIATIVAAISSVSRTTFTGFIQIRTPTTRHQTDIPRFKSGSILCQLLAPRDELLLATTPSSSRITGLKHKHLFSNSER